MRIAMLTPEWMKEQCEHDSWRLHRFLLTRYIYSELLDWVAWKLVRDECLEVDLEFRYSGLVWLKILSDRILNNLKELNTLLSVPEEGIFLSKFPHFGKNAYECMYSLNLYSWDVTVDRVLDKFHEMLPLMYKYYPGYAPQ